MSDLKSFQIVDIISDDLEGDTKEKSFVVTLYGINEFNHRIVCHVTKYRPYFYIKVPNQWAQPDGVKLIKDICGLRPDSDPEGSLFNSVKGVQLQIYKDLYGVQWNTAADTIQKFNYLKISLQTHDAMKKLIYATKKHYNVRKEEDLKQITPNAKIRLNEWRTNVTSPSDCDCNLYESSVHPIIKFIHDTKIEPTGWVSCMTKNDIKTGLFNSCKDEYSCSFKDIKPLPKNDLSSYRIASFDIECDSSHGDFPMPKKNFKKLATDVFDSYQAILKKLPESRRVKFNETPKPNLIKLISAGFTGDFTKFNSYFKYADMNKLHITNNEIPSQEIFDTIGDKILNSDYDILTDLHNLEVKGKDRDNCVTTIQDIIEAECIEINLTVEGDPIIQIGTVFYDYGLDKTTRHILVIAPEDNLPDNEICDDLEGIAVEKCKSERDLLMGWQKIIKDMDPDFITGYNIFGFDFKYIYERSKILFPCHHKCPKSKNKDSDPWYHVKGCPMKEFMNFGKMDSVPYKAKDHKCKKCTMKTQQLSSSALGDNTLHYIMMDGRILFDIQKEVQKGHNLESYKLDNVASHFMRGKLKSVDHKEIIVSDTGTLKDGDFISFRTHTNIGEGLFEEGRKYKIDGIHDKMITLTEDLNLELEEYQKVEWCLNKDDISPQQIFDKHKYEGASGRAEVAKYCVQDCELCIHLLLLLDIVPNNLGMANVSYVPASFIFLRGQGVKVTSVVTRMSSARNTRIPDLKKIPNLHKYIKMYKNGYDKEELIDEIIRIETEDGEQKYKQPKEWELEEWYKRIIHQSEKGMDGYEGAIVLDPKPGIYLDDPIAVLDYASLYPSSIIEKNISHETYIENKDLLPLIGKDNYYEIEYQDWIYLTTGKGDTVEKKDANTQTKCHFLKPEYMKEKGMFGEGEKEMGIIPAVLEHLLSARKATKKLMKNEPDEFKRKVLDGLQLAYKVTANSVYGQLGARTSTIYKMNLAACTTSIGRSRIDDASYGVKDWSRKKYGPDYPEPDVIYGDTDSVFVKFSRIKDGKTLVGKEALEHCMKCGQEAGEYITKGIVKVEDEDGSVETEQHEPLLCHPQDLEYEKTFWPFILISKKRYTGDKYEFDPDVCKRDAMGIVLKRRDNAPIVKHVFGNVIEKIMIEKDFALAVNWLKETLQMIRNGEFILRYFVITKALRGYYKNPKGIAHKVLADRMAERDPGNKPKANDRIPYAYINKGTGKEFMGYKKITERRQIGEFKNGKPKMRNFRVDDKTQPKYKKVNILQGDRIEHVDYIKDNPEKCKLDYEFYITNQIMNPVKQVLDLEMDKKETEKLFIA